VVVRISEPDIMPVLAEMESFERQLKSLADGTGIIDKDTLYFSELAKQNQIYLGLTIIGCLAAILGFIL